MKEKILEIIKMQRELVRLSEELAQQYQVELCGISDLAYRLFVFKGLRKIAKEFEVEIGMGEGGYNNGAVEMSCEIDGMRVFALATPKILKPKTINSYSIR